MAENAGQPALLQAQLLRKTYRMGDQDLRVLRGVSLSVEKGEWLAILGASGSGKSTLLHLLGGLDRPTEGKVIFEDREVYGLRASRINRFRSRDVGFVFQFYHLLPEMTALENVLLSAMIDRSIFAWPGQRRGLRQRAAELLDRVGLSERMHHRPNKLSGGERQRVAIARALMNEPALLFADEPTGNLDADSGDQILGVLRECHAAGQTVIMVTHDQRIARAAGRQLTLAAGKLVEGR